jgi:hypothetical protein
MTPQESTMLNDLVNKIQQTRLPEKDSEAESFLQERLGGNPDTLYILAQTVLVQNIALDRAQAQVKQLQEQVQQAQSQAQAQAQPHSTSFLGSLLGRRDPVPPPPPAPQSMGVPPPPPQYYPPAPAYAPNYAAAPPMAAPPPGGGGSSFLRSAATTAAGVAAGALAFEGVESLLHGFGHSGPEFGGGGFGGGGFGERPVEETVINNYYDDPNQSGMGDRREASFDDRSGDRFGGDQGMQLRDASYDTRGDEARGDLDRAQSSNDLQGIDTLDTDQTSGGFDDDSGYDNSDSFDDGGDDSNVL